MNDFTKTISYRDNSPSNSDSAMDGGMAGAIVGGILAVLIPGGLGLLGGAGLGFLVGGGLDSRAGSGQSQGSSYNTREEKDVAAMGKEAIKISDQQVEKLNETMQDLIKEQTKAMIDHIKNEAEIKIVGIKKEFDRILENRNKAEDNKQKKFLRLDQQLNSLNELETKLLENRDEI